MGERGLIWGAAWRLMLTGGLVFAGLLAYANGLPGTLTAAAAIGVLLLWRWLLAD